MTISDPLITISNLRLRTYIGFNEDEKEKRQDVILNIRIRYASTLSALIHDKVDEALNYKVITKRIIQLVEDGHFLLLEKLVSDVLDICCDHPSVNYASVTADKPYALRFADSVSLTLEYHA